MKHSNPAHFTFISRFTPYAPYWAYCVSMHQYKQKSLIYLPGFFPQHPDLLKEGSHQMDILYALYWKQYPASQQ